MKELERLKALAGCLSDSHARKLLGTGLGPKEPVDRSHLAALLVTNPSLSSLVVDWADANGLVVEDFEFSRWEAAPNFTNEIVSEAGSVVANVDLYEFISKGGTLDDYYGGQESEADKAHKHG
jgi:hypothetical protein